MRYTKNCAIFLAHPVGKACRAPRGLKRDAHLPLRAVEPVVDRPLSPRDAWPVQRQTYGYLPDRGASPPFVRYQIILLREAQLTQGCYSWQCFGPE